MSLFRVNMPPIPDDVQIHNIADTPTLKRAKYLMIIPIFLKIISFLIVVSTMSINPVTQEVEISPTNTIIINILGFCCIICMFLSYFYLSKLSLRRRIFNLYLAYFGIILLMGVVAAFANIIGNFILLVVFIGCIIICYILWQMGKELSFILNSPYFFKGIKLALIGGIIVGITSFIIAVIYAAVLGNLDARSPFANIILLITVLIFFAACITALAGSIFYLIGIFKINQVITYGEQTPNLIS